MQDIDRTLEALREAIPALAGHQVRVRLLDALAAALDSRRADIIKACADETALTPDELAPEFDRMTGTLRMFARLVAEGSWVRAAVDTVHPIRAAQAAGPDSPSQREGTGGRANDAHAHPLIGPNHDLRRMLVPLGPVAVFGASNFPLAYGVCGGDTASALAAGCPVVVKEHPAHPQTGRLLWGIAREAFRQCQLPEGSFGYVLNEDPSDFSPAKGIIKNTCVAAIGFTGSRSGGLAIDQIAYEQYRPIPVFAEMGSVNAILISHHAARARCEQIAEEIATSLLTRQGQQCTAPRLVFIPSPDESAKFFEVVARRIQAAPVRQMLSEGIAANYRRGMEAVLKTGHVHRQSIQQVPSGDPRIAPAAVLLADAIVVEDSREFFEEIFGPCLIVLQSYNYGDGHAFVPGALTTSIYFEPGEHGFEPSDWKEFATAHGPSGEGAGRLIWSGVPTGVRVAHAMVHGGPFPATNRPDSTAVGPLAIERWCRPVCFQNCPDALLPPELRNANPRNIWRMVNAEWTRSSIPTL